jgi:BirA family biotin operon repressor/biotin-[acetyl-CoA-carboxylase] ligase
VSAVPDLPLRWVDSAPSTQDLLLAAARDGRPPQAVATTNQQAGRGRRGRQWTCPPGAGLALSMLLRPARPDGWTWLPLLAGVAVLEALDQLGVRDAVLKWPNDVLARGGKLAGLLSERVEPAAPGGTPGFVLGVGLNLRSDALPPGAVGLDRLLPLDPPDAPSVARAVLDAVAALAASWDGDGPAETAARHDAYRQRCSTLGRLVQASLPDGRVLTGRARDLDPDGRLLLDPGTGPLLAVSAGDVVHVRPATPPQGDGARPPTT